MVAVRVSRQSGEVVADAGAPAAISRTDVEVAADAVGANAVDPVRVSRQSIEVVGKRTAAAAISRANVEVAADAVGANTVDAVRITRQSAEVVINQSAMASLTRYDVELAGDAIGANAVDPLRISRQSAEVVARRGFAGPVAPLALADDSDVFLHDWADEVRLASSYLTDVATSHTTGAESRRGLALKPSRSMRLVWRHHYDEVDAAGYSRLDRLYVRLRRMTNARFQVPLYADQRVLTASYGSGATVLDLDTTIGRWVVGARVVVVRLNSRGSYSSHSYHLIDDIQDDQLTLATTLGTAAPAGSVIMPVLDCEVELEVEGTHEHGCLAEVEIEVHEIEGASQLPPTKADTPTNGQTHLGIPILDVDPDWSRGVKSRRSRAGREFRSGRGRGVSVHADRSRQGYDLEFVNERPEFWRLVEFFDTRRGRLRSFWHVDQEHIWTPVQTDPNFVSIEQLGDLDDVQEELEGAYVGIVLADGTIYVREVVTVQAVVTVYRMTVTPVLPAINLADIRRVARARMVRFDSDEMQETWTHAGLCETRLRVLEVLNEGEVTS